MPESRNLAADAFAGAAEAYLKFRPPYPVALLEDVVAKAALPPAPRLVDLASGPGRIARALAPRFRAVDAVDLELDMIDVGAREGARLGLTNVRWTLGRAEDFEADPESVDLITVGEAFHRLDQEQVLRLGLCWLKPGGVFATMGGQGLFAAAGTWQAAVTQLARDWTKRVFPEGWASGRPGAAIAPDEIAGRFAAAGYETAQSATFTAPHVWTFETVLGFLESTSVCSKRILGADYDGFRTALAALLTSLGMEREVQALEFGYTLARKPAR